MYLAIIIILYYYGYTILIMFISFFNRGVTKTESRSNVKAWVYIFLLPQSIRHSTPSFPASLTAYLLFYMYTGSV